MCVACATRAAPWITLTPQGFTYHRQKTVLTTGATSKYGLLQLSDGTFAIDDLREYLVSNGDEYKRELSPFIRGDIPPERLPEVPDLKTLGELFEKRTALESKLRRTILLYLGMLCAWDDKKISGAITRVLPTRVDRSDPGALFVGRAPRDVVNELYTDDLKRIVAGHWELFSTLFGNDKKRFEMNMDTVNLARRFDAHTRPVTADERDNFLNSYSWLLVKLERVPQT